MQHRRLGNTDLYASEIALGTVELGLNYGIAADGRHRKPEEVDAVRLLNEAVDMGVNLIDTARAYGDSEEIIGKALMHRRSEVLLATKISPLTGDDLQGPNLHSRVQDSLETSLRMLQTEYVDLLMIHSVTTETIGSCDALVEMLQQFRQKGYARYVGASVYGTAAEETLLCSGLQCLQIAYSALDRRSETITLPTAMRRGVGIVLRSVLLRGAITPLYRSLPASLAPLAEAVVQLEGLADAAGMSLPELAFRYVLSADAVALCGTSRITELQTAIQAAGKGGLGEELMHSIRCIQVDPFLLNPSNWPPA